MNYMIAILPKMAGFLLLVLIGFTASRIGVIKKEAMPSISGFLLKIVLPALTISLIWENQTTFYTMARYGRMVIAQILMYFIMAAGGILGSRICHLSGTTSNVHRGCSVGGNYGFLVIPLIMTLFGDQGGNVYIPICSVIDTTLVWTLGFTLFTNGVGQKENPWKKIIMNPIFISIILGLCLTSFHIPVPDYDHEHHRFCWKHLLQLGTDLSGMQSWIYEAHNILNTDLSLYLCLQRYS